ncbi:hypothetical protein Tco_0940764 [Tanacetum coccineum]|uniref:Uncharacterized protein n=1 Tax=Tanacetum coccineum TaxID=301880 RepID=A0ABQ5DVM4_9ASTR
MDMYVYVEVKKKMNRDCAVENVKMRIIFGEGLSEEGLMFVIVKKGDEDDNQRIDYGINHIAIKGEKSWVMMIRDLFGK